MTARRAGALLEAREARRRSRAIPAADIERVMSRRRRSLWRPRPRSRDKPVSSPLHPRRRVEGEAREVGKVMAGIARQAACAVSRRRPPCCCRAARPRSRCGARPAAGAMSSSCSLPSRWAAPPGVFAPGRRHRRRRRRRGDRRRASSRPTRCARAGAGLNAKASARRQRRPRLLRGARRPGHHRTDADQRQRFPRHPDPGTQGGGRAGRE